MQNTATQSKFSNVGFNFKANSYHHVGFCMAWVLTVVTVSDITYKRVMRIQNGHRQYPRSWNGILYISNRFHGLYLVRGLQDFSFFGDKKGPLLPSRSPVFLLATYAHNLVLLNSEFVSSIGIYCIIHIYILHSSRHIFLHNLNESQPYTIEREIFIYGFGS